jgi:hypothetical protein
MPQKPGKKKKVTKLAISKEPSGKVPSYSKKK